MSTSMSSSMERYMDAACAVPNEQSDSGAGAAAGSCVNTTSCTGAGADGSGKRNVFLDSERFSVAPMVDVTDSVFRRMARIMCHKAMLYTEMIAAQALVHEKYHLIDFRDEELPCTLQLGGSEPQALALATRVGAQRGYSAINLNAGCPSDKVQSGNFGAVLMKTPVLIAQCWQAMQEAAGDIPVSVKTRIGVDELDSEDFTMELMGTIYEAGCRHIIVHARKAWLTGLSPKENRTVPPLDYERVFKIKNTFEGLKVTINGGITTIDQCRDLLGRVDGVMLGRAIIDNPYLLTSVDSDIFGADTGTAELTREVIVEKMVHLGEQLAAEGRAVHFLYRHLLGLYNGCPNSRLYRRYLSENMNLRGASPSVLAHAVKAMQRAGGTSCSSDADTVTTPAGCGCS